jgi:hypothetical protein
MPSGGIQQLVEEAESDVLLLYDSCHSAHPAVNISGQGVTELIAACGFETQAPAVGLHSFTNALIRELEESFAGPPISVAELHSRVISSLKNWKPSLLRDEDGNVWTDENGRAKYECHKRRTPIHCFLTNESPYRSIMLAPLPSKLSHASGTSKNRAIGSNGWVVGYETTLEACEPPFLTEKPYPTAEGQSSTSNEGLHSTLASQVSSSTQPTTVSGSWRTAEALRVLLAVRLEDDFFLDDEGEDDDGKKVRIWCNWLKAIPDGAQNISIEGVYKSCSALVIMSLPIALWDLLPDNAAYSFIGFVKPNILSKEELPSFEPVIDDSMPNKLLSAAPDLFEWNVQLPESLKSKATEGSNTLRADSNREHEIAQESQDYEDIGSTSTNFSVSERHFTLLRQLEEAKDRAAFLSHTSSLLAQLSFAKQEHRDMVDGDRNWRMVQELLKSERLRIDFLKFQLLQKEMDLRGLI